MQSEMLNCRQIYGGTFNSFILLGTHILRVLGHFRNCERHQQLKNGQNFCYRLAFTAIELRLTLRMLIGYSVTITLFRQNLSTRASRSYRIVTPIQRDMSCLLRTAVMMGFLCQSSVVNSLLLTRPSIQRTLSSRFLSMVTKNIPKVLFVLGGPAAGKGTQCIKLSNEYGMKHLSAGELLREEIVTGSANGQLISSYLKEGKIVPVQITLDLLRDRMESIQCNRFLVDGFPRNFDNVRGWESCMSEVCDVEGVMFIDCPEAELERRLLSRGESSGRSDDNIETARKRFATFKEATMPVVAYYESKNKLLRISGHQPVEQVFAEMKAAVVPLIEKEILLLTKTILKTIADKDWEAYSDMCDPSLTAFEDGSKVCLESMDFANP